MPLLINVHNNGCNARVKQHAMMWYLMNVSFSKQGHYRAVLVYKIGCTIQEVLMLEIRTL